MLTHVSPHPEPITLHAADQPVGPGYKPLGFWYEVDGDWRRWCRDDGMGKWVENGHLHELRLGDERILRISTVGALDRFTEEYGVPEVVAGLGRPLDRGIRWADIAESWDGIEIAPYHWTRRLEVSWYYGWDCASGCIWRPRGASLTPIGPVQVAP